MIWLLVLSFIVIISIIIVTFIIKERRSMDVMKYIEYSYRDTDE